MDGHAQRSKFVKLASATWVVSEWTIKVANAADMTPFAWEGANENTVATDAVFVSDANNLIQLADNMKLDFEMSQGGCHGYHVTVRAKDFPTDKKLRKG
jgi:hypothetical protein